MSKFRDIKPLQKFASVHASVQYHFSLDRHIVPRADFKVLRSAALVEWRQIAA